MGQAEDPPPGGGGVKRKIPDISGYVKQLRRFIVKTTDENKKLGELSLPKREIAIRASLGTSKVTKIDDQSSCHQLVFGKRRVFPKSLPREYSLRVGGIGWEPLDWCD